jgi:hypothetical protein
MPVSKLLARAAPCSRSAFLPIAADRAACLRWLPVYKQNLRARSVQELEGMSNVSPAMSNTFSRLRCSHFSTWSAENDVEKRYVNVGISMLLWSENKTGHHTSVSTRAVADPAIRKSMPRFVRSHQSDVLSLASQGFRNEQCSKSIQHTETING